MHTQQRWEIYNTRGENEERERVPCKPISARCSSRIVLHLTFTSIILCSPGKLHRLCPRDHHHTAWFPVQRRLASRSIFGSCCYPFPANSLKHFCVVLGTVFNVLALICPEQNALSICARKAFALFSINLSLSKETGEESRSYSIIATVP